jgi:polygalacturonase
VTQRRENAAPAAVPLLLLGIATPPTRRTRARSRTGTAAILRGADRRHPPARKDDTARIQAAIDACAPGHAVVLRPATRSAASSPVRWLRSGVSLLIDAGVTLYASSNPKAVRPRRQTPAAPSTRTGAGCKPFITADNTRGSGIMGRALSTARAAEGRRQG